MSAAVYAVATMDTKGSELAFLTQSLRAAGVPVRTVDVGTRTPPTVVPDVLREVVLGNDVGSLGDDRGIAVTRMGAALTRYLRKEVEAGRVLGVIGSIYWGKQVKQHLEPACLASGAVSLFWTSRETRQCRSEKFVNVEGVCVRLGEAHLELGKHKREALVFVEFDGAMVRVEQKSPTLKASNPTFSTSPKGLVKSVGYWSLALVGVLPMSQLAGS